MSTNMKCPDCDNGKSEPPVFIKWSPGRKPATDADMREALEKLSVCDRCHGTGAVPEEMAEWINHGEQMRLLRLSAGVGLRDGAQMLGVRPSELSDLERGMVNNLNAEVCY